MSIVTPPASPSSPNQSQSEYWNGAGGERWVRHQVVIEQAFEPFGAAALARLSAAAGESVLDVGCGAGQSSLTIARSVGVSGRVLGLDLSRPMLQRARERAAEAGLGNLSFVEGDASSHVFETRFAAAFSRFGVMFFSDPVLAFTHLRGTLLSGGRLVFACWQSFEDNPWVALPFAAAREVVPNAALPIDPEAPGPFSFGSPGRVGGILNRAGYQRVEIQPFSAPVAFSRDGVESAVDFSCQVGPVGRLVTEHPEPVRLQIREKLRTLLQPLDRGGHIELGGAVWLVRAEA
jgi:SAM-dependent methyltransferase